ncbi:MAG TPA: hypothetical protein VEK11_02030 [Thermoanaerobaculia bacterium]|nr:hypothetical protein [Thermoanaerobaculia bacterium]
MRKSLVLFALAFATPLFAADAEHAFQNAIARGSVKRIVVDIPTGSFTIRNGSAERLALSGIASRDYDSARERDWAQRVVNDTSVEFYVSGAEAIVRRKFGRNAQSWRAQKFTGLDLRLELPPGIDISFETTAGEVDLSGDFGDIDIDMTAGEVDVTVPRAKVRELSASCRIGEVRTNLGQEVVTKEGVLPGRTKYFNAAGRTHVNVHVTAGEIDVTLAQ